MYLAFVTMHRMYHILFFVGAHEVCIVCSTCSSLMICSCDKRFFDRACAALNKTRPPYKRLNLSKLPLNATKHRQIEYLDPWCFQHFCSGLSGRPALAGLYSHSSCHSAALFYRSFTLCVLRFTHNKQGSPPMQTT